VLFYWVRAKIHRRYGLSSSLTQILFPVACSRPEVSIPACVTAVRTGVDFLGSSSILRSAPSRSVQAGHSACLHCLTVDDLHSRWVLSRVKGAAVSVLASGLRCFLHCSGVALGAHFSLGLGGQLSLSVSASNAGAVHRMFHWCFWLLLSFSF
jgi:hypothetical protein